MKQERAQLLWRQALSVVLAALLLLAVAVERRAERTLTVPVLFAHMPRGLALEAPPTALSVTVSGPRILLFRLRFREPVCRLDLTGLSAGPASFAVTESALDLDDGLKVTRAVPSPVTLTLVGQERR